MDEGALDVENLSIRGSSIWGIWRRAPFLGNLDDV